VIVLLLKWFVSNCFLRLTRWLSRLVDPLRSYRLLHHFLGLNSLSGLGSRSSVYPARDRVGFVEAVI
ncbi:MAG: hypothetical protein ACYCTI_14055, partial [Acidimicrobiales bacterium]